MMKKAITFSYDDGITQDIRLIEIFDKYNLKGTFNLNSGCFESTMSIEQEGAVVSHHRLCSHEIDKVYKNHEVAAHTMNHLFLPDLSEQEIIYQVEKDRLNLSEIMGYEVVGMAYPCGGKNYNERVADIIQKNTGIKYARTLQTDDSFNINSNLLCYKPTCHHHKHWSEMFELGERFIELETDIPKVFCIWGHSYEFDIYPERWEAFEQFCEKISNKKDVFYGTNREIFLSKWYE